MFSDDEYDNNPFVEPVDKEPQHIFGNGNGQEPETNEEEPIDADADDQTEQTDELNATSQAPVKASDKLDIRRLIPERFTKSSIHITLTQIERNKPGNPILRFDVKVKQLPRFRQEVYKDVRRTYNECVKFNKYLTISNLECFVPVIPLATTAYPTNGEDEQKQLMFVWQEWLDRICGNPILIRDEEFVFFIENDFGYQVINPNKKSAVASGILRKTLKQFAIPDDEYEELDTFRPLIKSWYIEGGKLHKQITNYSKALKQVSIQVYDLSQKLLGMSQFENSHPGMKNMWEKLSRIQHLQSDLQLIELVNEMGSVGDGIHSIVDDFYQIKEALTNRHLIMRELIQADAQTKSRHQAVEKSKTKIALDPVRADDAIRQLEYAKKTQELLELQVQRISGEMLLEREEVIDFTEKRLQKILKRYTVSKIEHHRKILKNLENIRLDVRIVDQKGGLSRLNRDNLSSLKHNLVQSQGAEGDAWSGRVARMSKEEKPVEDKDIVFDAKNAAQVLGKALF